MIVDAGTATGTSTGPRFTVHHKSQTNLAAQFDPPDASLRGYFFVGAYLLIYFIFGNFLSEALLWSDTLHWYAWLPIRIALCTVAFAFYYSAIRFGFPDFYQRLQDLATAHARQLEDYAVTWVCLDCGHRQVVR